MLTIEGELNNVFHVNQSAKGHKELQNFKFFCFSLPKFRFGHKLFYLCSKRHTPIFFISFYGILFISYHNLKFFLLKGIMYSGFIDFQLMQVVQLSI